MMTLFIPLIMINDAEMVQEIFVDKGKFFDKDQTFGKSLQPLLGESLFLVPGDDKWAKKRKAAS